MPKPTRPDRRASGNGQTSGDFRGSKWGGVARRGAATAKRPVGTTTGADERSLPSPADEWVRQDEPAKRRRARKSSTAGVELSDDATKEIERLAGRRAPRLLRYMQDAAGAYAAERWRDAKRALRPLLDEVPDAPAVQELHGMVLYRTGKWKDALAALQTSHDGSGSYSMHPAMMDCARALGRKDELDELWADLREASPGPETMAEGRIVYAAALADGGDVAEALKLLEKAPTAKGKVRPHHLRLWYARADMLERSGDVARARRLFEQIAEHDPDMADVDARIENLT